MTRPCVCLYVCMNHTFFVRLVYFVVIWTVGYTCVYARIHWISSEMKRRCDKMWLHNEKYIRILLNRYTHESDKAENPLEWLFLPNKGVKPNIWENISEKDDKNFEAFQPNDLYSERFWLVSSTFHRSWSGVKEPEKMRTNQFFRYLR